MSAERVVVGVATPKGMSAPYAYFAPATALGYDREEGFELRFFFGGEPGSTARALCSGECDIACLNTIVGIMGRANEQLPMIAIGSKARRAHRYFSVLPESAIRQLSDLRGRSIACDFPHLRPLAEAALAEEGVSKHEFQWKDWQGSGMDIAGMVQPFQAGDVDALFIMDWTEGDAVARGVQLRHLSSKLLNRIRTSSCYWTTETKLRSQPDLLGRALRVLNKSLTFSFANPELAIRLMWKTHPETKPDVSSRERVLKHDLEVVKACLKPMALKRDDPDPRWCAMPANEMVEWQKFLLSSGAISNMLNLDRLYTSELVEIANRFDSAAIENSAVHSNLPV